VGEAIEDDEDALLILRTPTAVLPLRRSPTEEDRSKGAEDTSAGWPSQDVCEMLRGVSLDELVPS